MRFLQTFGWTMVALVALIVVLLPSSALVRTAVIEKASAAESPKGEQHSLRLTLLRQISPRFSPERRKNLFHAGVNETNLELYAKKKQKNWSLGSRTNLLR
ncbi:unnamed protein product [Nippostrongylus brasiliensis]|uniref:Secreted RxLR effector peptide protein n=1 Tax=Nippostrongylus brasiliensis TaxID=27835 RepID=A0A0N4XG24_NIPBR|nr:unnamed protein product [Nippostrongylus brasiliensis]